MNASSVYSNQQETEVTVERGLSYPLHCKSHCSRQDGGKGESECKFIIQQSMRNRSTVEYVL